MLVDVLRCNIKYGSGNIQKISEFVDKPLTPLLRSPQVVITLAVGDSSKSASVRGNSMSKRTRCRQSIGVSLLALGLSGALYAQQPQADPEAVRTFDTVVVTGTKIGRASCRERVRQYVKIWVGEV